MLHAKMEYKWFLIILAFLLVPVNCNNSSLEKCYHCSTHPKASTQGRQLEGMSGYEQCCKGEVDEYFKSTHYKKTISKGNLVEVNESSSYEEYRSFISACAHYQPYGFGNTYINGNFFGDMEVAAFLAHVGSTIYCGNQVASKEQLAQGSCYKKEMNFNSSYCDERYANIYPCAPGVGYYGRGFLPIYWNYNYGKASKDLNVDLLSHPESIEKNMTLAFQVSLWRWMIPIKEDQPSAHNVFIGYLEPTKNDTLANGVSGFAATMKVLYGDLVCGQDDNKSMNSIISNYQHYLDTMGIAQEARSHEVLSCANQVASNPLFSSWMTPIKEDQPSAHNFFIGYLEPTKNDTLANGVSGFAATMKVLYGDLVCGQDDNKSMNNIISNYQHYLDTMGIAQEARSHEVLSYANQVASNPSFSSYPRALFGVYELFSMDYI